MSATFRPGSNIALKVPVHEFDATVRFYRDVLAFEQLPQPAETGRSEVFRFGDKQLWVDEVATLSQAEIWLELVTDDLEAAAATLAEAGCARRDEIEPLPDGLHAMWISGPANIIHLVVAGEQ